MARLIRTSDLKEGELFCKWLHNRIILNNKNVLGAELGATGTGKSWRDLRKFELWYLFHFKERVPAKNICFGVTEVMRRLSSGELRKGDVLIFEEAGVNLGSLDFQNKVVKMFTYVLQSFRSMNVSIFFNIPYLSMMSKQARMLLHYSFESAGIDYKKGVGKCKPFFHQVNQGTGKIYKKYMRAKVNGKVQKVKRFQFNKPSQYLIDIYEGKKIKYLAEMTKEYTDYLEEVEKEKMQKLGRSELTDKQIAVYELACSGLSVPQIASLRGIETRTVYNHLEIIKKKGYVIEKQEIPLENEVTEVTIPLQTPSNPTSKVQTS